MMVIVAHMVVAVVVVVGFEEVRIVDFDGRNDWDAQAQALAYKSKT